MALGPSGNYTSMRRMLTAPAFRANATLELAEAAEGVLLEEAGTLLLVGY